MSFNATPVTSFLFIVIFFPSVQYDSFRLEIFAGPSLTEENDGVRTFRKVSKKTATNRTIIGRYENELTISDLFTLKELLSIV